jgi:hypothetical protein
MNRSGFFAAGIGLAAGIFAVAASAQTNMTPWDGDTAKRFTFSAPTGWPVDRLSQPTAGVTEYEAGAADAACKFYVIDRPEQANQPPDGWLRANSAALSAQRWTEVLQPFPAFRGGVSVDSSSIDTNTFWPQQRAQLTTSSAKITAAVSTRPGLEIYTFCQSYDSKDRSGIFDAIIKSIATPRDSELKAAAEAGAAARAAREAAGAQPKAAEQPAAQPEEQKKKRRSGRSMPGDRD